MAWTAPKTWIDGELVTASLLNTQVRDNANDVNTRLSTVEARTTETTTGNTQLGARLATVESRTTNTTTGNTQLGTRVGAVETRSSENASLLSNHTGRLDADHNRLTTLENRTTNTTSGNTQLSDRLATVESRTTHNTTGNEALGMRVTTLETSGGGGGGNGGGSVGPITGGSWRLTNTSQGFAQAAITRIPVNTVVVTPANIVNNNNGTWTITRAGWWDFSARCDLAMNTDYYQEWMIIITNVTQNLKIASDQFFWVRNAYTDGSAAGPFYCNAGDVIEFTGVFYIDVGAARTYYPVSTSRSGFTAVYRGI